MHRLTHSEERIVQAALNTVELALNYIYERIGPGKQGLDEIWYPSLQKWLLLVDHDAQLVAEEYLEKELQGIEIRGEESTLRKFSGGIAALLDMLDGSDLLKEILETGVQLQQFLMRPRPRLLLRSWGCRPRKSTSCRILIRRAHSLEFRTPFLGSIRFLKSGCSEEM